MSLTLSIPDEIASAIKFPRRQLDRQLAIEMAFALYGRGMLSMGSARHLAKIDKWAFIEELAERQILRHYSESELDEDIDYAKSSSQ